jgi:hypothetical protein
MCFLRSDNDSQAAPTAADHLLFAKRAAPRHVDMVRKGLSF